MGDLFNPYAFALGMVALLNPCGFALLPAYLGFFLGMDDDLHEPRIVALNRAQMVGLSLSLGFLAVFGLLGVILAGFYTTIAPVLPWVTIVIGVALVSLGVAMLAGWDPMVALPKLQKGGDSRSTTSMFLFGVSYAVTSLSCTIGLFLGVVGSASSGRTFGERLGGFLSYGLGMGLLASALTLAVAFGKRGLVSRFRQVLPHINRISALVLVVVGLYVVVYGWWSAQVLVFHNPPTGFSQSIVAAVESRQASLTQLVNNHSTTLGWSFFLINAALVVAGVLARRASPRPGHTAKV